jgi:hypothetical protein
MKWATGSTWSVGAMDFAIGALDTGGAKPKGRWQQDANYGASERHGTVEEDHASRAEAQARGQAEFENSPDVDWPE